MKGRDTFDWKTEARVGRVWMTLRASEDPESRGMMFESVSVEGRKDATLTLEETEFLADTLPGAETALTAYAGQPSAVTGEHEQNAGPEAFWSIDAELGERSVSLTAMDTENGPKLNFLWFSPVDFGSVTLSPDESRFLAQSLPPALTMLNRWQDRQEALRMAEWERRPEHLRHLPDANPEVERFWESLSAPQAVARKRQRAEAVREYGELARQIACMITERIPADNRVHRMDLQNELINLLSEADRTMDGREMPEARRIAKSRAMADRRVFYARDIEGSSAYSIETARFQHEPFFAETEKVEEWRKRFTGWAERPDEREFEPRRLERLAAAALGSGSGGRDSELAEAMVAAIEYGSPPLNTHRLREERSEIVSTLAACDRLPEGKVREEMACRLYRAFSATEIRAMAGNEEGRVSAAFRAAHGAQADRIASRVAELHDQRLGTPAPWYGLYETIGALLQRGRSRGIGISIAAD